MNTDVEWEKWGKSDPYFAVLTHQKFRNENLTPESKEEFFESGKSHVNQVLKTCREHFDQDFEPDAVLDFGCGTGRLVIPFAGIASQVVGLDVSDSMLDEARKNCEEQSLRNVRLIKSDDNLSNLHGQFDLVNSFIVFQHIPVERGGKLFTRLLDHLNEGGICAIHVLYSMPVQESIEEPPPDSLARKANRRFWRLVNILKRSGQATAGNEEATETVEPDPEMQMNPYDLNEIFLTAQSAGIQRIFFEFTDHGGALGTYLYFQKPKRD